MAYVKKELVDNETLIDRLLLGHMQDGIYDAHQLLSVAIYAVLTADQMDTIIQNATPEDVGTFLMYLGETTDSYKKGSVYRIGEV